MSHLGGYTIFKNKDKYFKEEKSAQPMQTKMVRKFDRLIPEVEKILLHG
jgi:hypothetical protein